VFCILPFFVNIFILNIKQTTSREVGTTFCNAMWWLLYFSCLYSRDRLSAMLSLRHSVQNATLDSILGVVEWDLRCHYKI
jgi:hypothetical protein